MIIKRTTVKYLQLDSDGTNHWVGWECDATELDKPVAEHIAKLSHGLSEFGYDAYEQPMATFEVVKYNTQPTGVFNNDEDNCCF